MILLLRGCTAVLGRSTGTGGEEVPPTVVLIEHEASENDFIATRMVIMELQIHSRLMTCHQMRMKLPFPISPRNIQDANKTLLLLLLLPVLLLLLLPPLILLLMLLLLLTPTITIILTLDPNPNIEPKPW